MDICSICGRHYNYQRGKSCTRNKCNTCYVSGNRKKRKETAVALFGGKCQKCGYNKSFRALTFHHVNSKEKEFALSVAHTLSWERYVKELNKCVLLCHNCHSELHDKLWKIEDITRVYLGDDVRAMVIPTGRACRKFTSLKTKKCLSCGNEYQTKSSKRMFCSDGCYRMSLRRAVRPSKEQLEQEMQTNSWSELGRKYGITGNAVKKWARRYFII